MIRTTRTAHALWCAVLLWAGAACRQPAPGVFTSWEQLPTVAERAAAGNDTLIVCHPERMGDSIVLPLSHFVEELEVVALESSDGAYVRSASVRVSDNYILCHSSRNMPFKLFDRKGRFVCTIGKSGGGRGGYGQVCDFQLDEEYGRIYLMPWNATRLMAYDLQGRPQPDIPLHSPDEREWWLPKAVFHVDGKRREVTVAALPWEANPRMAWVQDFEGNILREIPANPYRLPRDYSTEIRHLHSTGDNRLVPVFTLDFPEGNLMPHYHDELPTCFIGTIVGRMEQTGLTTSESRMHSNFIVDKRTLRGGPYRVYNDFLGNTDVYWLNKSHNGYYARNLSPQMLKEELTQALQRHDLAPDMRQKVATLAASINTERDNNYLMIGRLRKE